MMFPTTVLSVLAVSAAAENTSSGNRGLRKSSIPYTAIAVVSGTALTGLLAGIGLGYFIKSQAGKSCAQLTQLGIQGTCTGCAAGFYEKKANECAICPNGKNSPGASFTGAAVDEATGCKGCKADYYQTGDASSAACVACPNEKELAATTEWAAAATSCTERVCEVGKTATLTDPKECKCKAAAGGATNQCKQATPKCHATDGTCAA